MTRSRFTQTPTWAMILVELVIGLVFIIFAALNATVIDSTTGGLLAVAMGIVGGIAVGLSLGLTKHLLSARATVE